MLVQKFLQVLQFLAVVFITDLDGDTQSRGKQDAWLSAYTDGNAAVEAVKPEGVSFEEYVLRLGRYLLVDEKESN